MNFEIDEDQKMVRDTVRRYAEESLGPRAEGWDEDRALPRDVFLELRDLGLLGLTLPAASGGSGLDEAAALLAVEELARYDASTALSLVAHTILVGELAQKLGADKLVAELAAGEKLGTWPMSSIAEARTRLTVESGDAPTLDGQAAELIQCRHADVGVLFAHTADGSPVTVLADAEELDARRVPNDGPLGCRAADLGAWQFDDAVLSDDALLSDRDRYSAELESELWARAQSYLGAVAVGIGRGALEEGLAYANDREQFGQPISRFQATQFKLADMSTRVDAARLTVLRSGTANSSAGRRARAAQLAATVAIDVADEAVQLHGGYGYTSEYPVERYLRDARSVASMLGGNHERSQASAAELEQDTPIFAQPE
ncbi:MAG: acyl-CoA dehydrogenase family protein [Myxococcota bacterium]